jgi:hypothetical protein
MAFTVNSMKRMWARDRGICKTCGKNVESGWNLDASHVDHDKLKFYYDNIGNGKLECLWCHLKRHLALWVASRKKQNERWESIHRFSVQALEKRILAGDDRWDRVIKRTGVRIRKIEIQVLYEQYGFDV